MFDRCSIIQTSKIENLRFRIHPKFNYSIPDLISSPNFSSLQASKPRCGRLGRSRVRVCQVLFPQMLGSKIENPMKIDGRRMDANKYGWMQTIRPLNVCTHRPPHTSMFAPMSVPKKALSSHTVVRPVCSHLDECQCAAVFGSSHIP